jgi:AcrR family transcriptional regulator
MQALSDSVDRVDEPEEFSTRILDAAGDLFSQFGIQRVTMEEVARAAGVARVTIYRRFATRDVLVEHVVRREFRRYFDQFLRDIKHARTAADRVVVGFVSSLSAIRGNSLIGGLLAAEPNLLVPSLVGDQGRTLGTVREFIAGQLRREQAAGTIPSDLDVDLVAEMMVRISTSFLVTPSDVVDLGDPEQVAEIARRFLVPMIETTG